MGVIDGWLRDLSSRYGLNGLVVGVLLGLLVVIVLAVLIRWLGIDVAGLVGWFTGSS